MSAAPRRVKVALGDRAYDILIGSDLIARAGEHCAPHIPKRRAIVVTDDAVARLHLDALTRALKAAGIDAPAVVVPAGEASKDFAEFGRLMERLLDQRPDRDTVLIALGGGVVGDLCGFAASVLLRGVDFIQIPTTLLAQVDSSVGGKTAINTRHGKNLVGTFYQPRLVLADTGVLDTLPRRELLAGYAEIAKYGLIDDEPFFAWLEANGQAVVGGDARARGEAIARSCLSKARIVAEDEREQAGVRDLLNLGHTFGHALEKEVGFGGELLHGEAVAIGMVLAFDMSAALGLCLASDARRVRAHLEAVGLPVSPLTIPGVNARGWDVARLVDHMRADKKNRDGKLTFILARGIGQSFVRRGVEGEAALDTMRRALAA
ncbi:MAG: 3-dehydroquinate synthase [Alphaproteobacteria bacterium]|nr:3-dehydroquinate synthase [Alphaproteobacteria bacterium]